MLNLILSSFQLNFPPFFRLDRSSAGATIALKNGKILGKIRRLQFSTLEIVAYIGGILGLFAGFSILSLIELLYFLMIRPLIDVEWKNHDKIEKQSEATIVTMFINYFEISTIKSLNYIAEEKSKISRLFWFALSLYVLYECFRTSLTFYRQLKSDEIAISFDPITIDQIPFPAVTISSDLQTNINFIGKDFEEFKLRKSQEKFFNTSWKEILMEKYNNIPTIAEHLACFYHGRFEMESIRSNFTNQSDVINYLKNIQSYQLWFNESVSSWNSMDSPPIQKIVLKQGIAHSFNIVNMRDFYNFSIVTEDFLVSPEFNETTPWKPQSNGESTFSITLKRNKYLDKNKTVCYTNGVMIHSPYEIPKSQNADMFSFGSKTEIFVNVEISIADESIRSIDIKKRQCYFEREMKLRFFKFYSEMNCLAECKTLITLKKCGCVPHHYVRTKDMKVCDLKGMHCTRDSNEKLNGPEFDEMYKKYGACRCYKQCNHINYQIGAFSTKYDKNYKEG